MMMNNLHFVVLRYLMLTAGGLGTLLISGVIGLAISIEILSKLATYTA